MLVQAEVDVENKQGVLLCLVASASGVDYPVTPFSIPDAAAPHVFIDNERSGHLIIRYQHANRRIQDAIEHSVCFSFARQHKV